MSGQEQDFLDAIAAHPEDDAPKLIFADWLEEQGDGRAEFVRAAAGSRDFKRVAVSLGLLPLANQWYVVSQARLDGLLWALFTADCAGHVLPIFEEAFPDDRRPRQAIRTLRELIHEAPAGSTFLPSAKRGALAQPANAANAAANAAGGTGCEAGYYAASAAGSAAFCLLQDDIAGTASSAAASAATAIMPSRRSLERHWQLVRLGEYMLFTEPIHLLPTAAEIDE